MKCPEKSKGTCPVINMCKISDIFHCCSIYKSSSHSFPADLQELSEDNRNGMCAACGRPNKRFSVNSVDVCARCGLRILVQEKEFIDENCKDLH